MSKKQSKNSKPNISYYYFLSQKNLQLKYNSFEYSYQLVCINNIIYTEKCHAVARFKDFLYYDDATEFFHKFFKKKELNSTLTKVFNFYAKYCKVFPNYMILPENEFLYRNLIKKQKMIDQFNEIKREEEENRKHLKLKKNKENENDYIIFNKNVQDSIEKYRPSFSQSTIIMNEYLNYSNIINNKKESKIFNENSITISLNYNNINTNTNNFDLNDADINSSELSLISIANNIGTEKNIIDKKNNNNNNKVSFTPPKKKLKHDKIISFDEKDNNSINKKYISHYQNNKNSSNSNNNNDQKKNSNKNNNNYIDMHKNEIKNNNNINNNNANISAKKNINISQSKTSNNLIISSVTKTNKEKNNKNLTKTIKSNITKKKLFSATEKPAQHKKQIYNNPTNQIKKPETNSNSIISNKYKKYKDIISISTKPSISPPNTKLNSLKFKLMNNNISKSKNKNNKSNILINNNSNKTNNLSYINKNKNMKSFQIIDNNNNIDNTCDKNNFNKNKEDKKIGNNKKTVKEIMNNYKNILKTKKTSHYSHDINKNNIFSNKNLFNNFTEKNIQKNTSNRNDRKAGQYNKYISPVNKKELVINSKNPKTPIKPEFKVNNKFQNIITKTKEASQTKMQNFIKKIFEKNNKKNYFINQKNQKKA